MPNAQQRRQMSRFAGCARYVYNKALALKKELYEKKEMSVAEIMALTGFASRYSFYKYVVHAGSDALSTDKKGKRPKKTEGRENEGREKK